MKRIMKKTYINPEVEVIEMQMQQSMLAESGPDILDDNDGTDKVDDLLQREFGSGLFD